jgi:hypothetical protein
MIQADNSLPRARSWWRAAWPIWTLAAFAALALTNQLPSGVARAAVAAPILLAAPGALTIGAVLDRRRRPQGASSACLAGLLSVLWSAFASLALYVFHFLITAESTYWCLLAVCGGLAIAAQVRLLSERSDTGRSAVMDARIADRPGSVAEEISDTSGPLGTGPEQPDPPGALRRFGYIAAAVVAGASLLAGGTLAYLHVPHPTPAGYTWLAWTSPPTEGTLAVGQAGARLPFEILHQQSDATAYQLSAAWIGTSQQPLAQPLTLLIGPDKTIHGTLTIPEPPGGCTYRLVVTLTARKQIDPLTKQSRTWSINVDVRSAQPRKACTS